MLERNAEHTPKGTPACARTCAVVNEQDRMRQSVERMARIGAWSYRPGDRELVLTPVAREICGLAEAVTLRAALRSMPSTQRAPLVEGLRRLMTAGEPLDVDLLVASPSGLRHVRVRGQRAELALGPVFEGSVQDETERRRVEAQVATAERMLASACSMAGIGIWAVELPSGALHWSDEVFEIHDLPVGEPPTVERAIEFYDADAQEALRDAMAQVEAHGEPYDLELPMTTAAGRRIWVRTIGDLERVDGVPVRLFGTFQDVTNRRCAEEELRRRERRLQMALDGANDGVWDWDLVTDSVYFSPGWKRLLGYEDHEFASDVSAWLRSMHPDDAARVRETVRRYLAGETETYSCEHRLRHKDGSWRTHLGRGKIVDRDERGRPTRFVGTQVDITEQVELREELQRAKETAEAAARAKSDFLAVMSHEIRTPLNGILGMAQIMKGRCADPELEEAVQAIHSSGDLLLSLLNDVLDLSKIEAGRLELERFPFDLRQALGDVLDLQRAVARSRGIVLELDWDGRLGPHVVGDVARIKQVFHNLVGNALKFDERGCVRVAVRKVGGGPERVRVRFEVSDSGPGIATEVQKGLFEAFRQGDASTTRRYGGTGLGLAICKRIVDAMGGEIGLRSAPGQGATFWFELELGRGRESTARVADAGDEADETALGFRVLVVEDNPVNQLVARKMLVKLGCRVDVAGNGREGIEMAVRFPYDVILMDCQMPEMDGYEATERIVGLDGERGRVPILAMTANVRPEDRARCVAAGMVGFVSKPVRLADLRAGLLRAVGARA